MTSNPKPEPMLLAETGINKKFHLYLNPRYINNLTPKEKLLIRDLAFSIVKHQQSRFVVPPGTLLAAVMMQHRGGLHIDELARKVDWLKMQACNMGAYVDWPGEQGITLNLVS